MASWPPWMHQQAACQPNSRQEAAISARIGLLAHPQLYFKYKTLGAA